MVEKNKDPMKTRFTVIQSRDPKKNNLYTIQTKGRKRYQKVNPYIIPRKNRDED